MGDRRDFIEMFGLPREVECPRCKNMIDTRFYEASMFEFDLPTIRLHLHCGDCEDEGYAKEKYVTDTYWYTFEIQINNVKLVPMR